MMGSGQRGITDSALLAREEESLSKLRDSTERFR